MGDFQEKKSEIFEVKNTIIGNKSGNSKKKITIIRIYFLYLRCRGGGSRKYCFRNRGGRKNIAFGIGGSRNIWIDGCPFSRPPPYDK